MDRFGSANNQLHGQQKEKESFSPSVVPFSVFSNAASFLGGMGTEGRMAEMPTFSLEDIALGELLKLSGRFKEFDLQRRIEDYGEG